MATLIRPNQEFTVKANVSRGDTRLVSWIIFQGHGSNEANILNIYPKHGLEMNHSFPNEGKFRFAAYNKEIQTKADFHNSPELKHVDIEVKFNQLDGTKLIPKNSNDFLAGDIFRKDFPAVFEAKFLINPPTQEEINRLQFMLEDGSGNTLDEGTQVLNIFTFTPRNSNAKYIIKASYTNESGAVSSQTYMGTSKAISIRDITHNEQVVRPGTPMSFSVAKTQFGGVSNDSDLPEQGNIKWNLDKVFIGSGRTINISGHQLMQKKKYHIEAYVTSAIGKTTGDNEDGVKNDWHFEVKENIVEKIKIVKKPKAGLVGEFEIEKMTLNYDPQKDGVIKWNVVGASTGNGTESGLKFSYKFNASGSHTISCTVGGRTCKEPITIEVVQASINVDTSKWIDNDGGSGNILTKAGYDQKVNAFVLFKGLDGEEVMFNVYDDDTGIDDPIYTQTATLKENSSGVYWPLKLTKKPTTEFDGTSIQEKIEKKGLTKSGELYFQLIPTNADLITENVGKDLGRILNVIAEPEIVNAYFCDANDTEQLFSCSLEGALYFKIYAINLVGRKVEITFITESDAYWTWDNEMEITDWESIKNKFEDEKIRDNKTGTFNEKGEILVPVDLSKMGKPKNFIRLNAMVKILPDENAEEKQEEKGFYMQHNNLAILYPGATLPAMAEIKGAVKVGREGIKGGENKTGDCFCNKDFEEKDVKQLVKLLKGSEKIWEGQALKGGKRAVCNISDKTFATLTKELNAALKKYNINTCTQKMHFLAQVCEETGTFALSEETKSQYASSTSVYKGRGLLQLTGVKANGKDTYDNPGPYKDYADYKGDQSIIRTPEIVANNVHYCIDSGAWIWGVNKKMPSSKDSQAVKRWGEETAGKSLNELAVYVDKYFELISVLLNGRNDKTKMPNGWEKRKSNYDALKNNFFMYDTYHGDNNKPVNAKDIITFRIYANGEIEKHIPKTIVAKYQNKYSYVYHDKGGKEHDICIVDFVKAQNWIVGSKIDGGRGWEKRTAGGKTRYYQKGNGEVELVKVVVPINYNKNGVKIKIGDNTAREFLNPKAFASMLGAVANCGYDDFNFNGSTSQDGTGAPSVTHVNGVAFDFRYLRKDKTGNNLHIDTEPNALDVTRQENFINELIAFGYSKFYSYNITLNGKSFILKNSTHLADHNHHLHIRREGYNPKYKEIKE